MSYIGKSPSGSGVRTRYYFTQTSGGGTSISGTDDNGKTLTYTDGEYMDVYLNGVLLVHGTDYGTGTANTISSLAALASGDVVEVVVYDIFNVAKINNEAVRKRYYKTASGSETSISGADDSGATITFPANAEIEVKLNGVALVQGTDYNTTSANTVGGLSALSAGQVVEIVVYERFVLGDTVSKADGGTFSSSVGFNGGATFPDSAELVFGTGSDFKISHNGSKTKLEDTGTGNLEIRGTNIEFYSGDGGETLAKLTDDGAAELYHNNTKRIETTTAGVSVTAGSASAPGYSFTTDTSTGMYLPSADNLGLAVAGGERITINNQGQMAHTANTADYAYVVHNDGNNTNRYGIRITCGSDTGSGTNYLVGFRDGDGNSVGSITFSGSTTSFNTSSDHRLKENVADMTGAIARVKQLAPKRFNFIRHPNTTVDGFLAHETQTVVPEAITGTHNEVDDDGNAVYQAIDQAKLVPLLVGALKESIAKIETLETEMTALKARVTALEDA